MSLADEAQAHMRTHGVTCAVRKLDPGTREEFFAALLDDRLTNTAISRALGARGYTISDQVVGRHRSGAGLMECRQCR